MLIKHNYMLCREFNSVQENVYLNKIVDMT